MGLLDTNPFMAMKKAGLNIPEWMYAPDVSLPTAAGMLPGAGLHDGAQMGGQMVQQRKAGNYGNAAMYGLGAMGMGASEVLPGILGATARKGIKTGLNGLLDYNSGPQIPKELYERIDAANSKKRSRWSPDGEAKTAYNDIEATRQTRRDAAPTRLDPLELASRNRDLRLNRIRATRKADAAIDPAWNAAFAKKVRQDIVGGFSSSSSINKANMESVPRLLRKEGWTMRHGSTGRDGRKSSRYVVSPDGKYEVRLSDHELPDTAQRRDAQSQYGTRWNDEIILSGNDSPQDIITEIKNLYQEGIE